jgi:murein DD-endopeptidase MepM/ murein hydrolase activator NlpD
LLGFLLDFFLFKEARNMVTRRWIAFLFFFSIFLTPTVSSVLASHSIKLAVPSTGQISGSPVEPVELPDIEIVKGIVQKGDTTSSLLNKYLPLKTIYALDRQSADIFSLRRINRGHPYKVILQDGSLTGFEYEIDRENRLVIQKETNGFSISQIPIDYDVRLEAVTATIDYSLFEAVRKSGERSELAWKLSDIFAWDIDFIRDIQPGDSFQVLVEKRYQEGKLAGYGKIQAAVFINKGIRFDAFLHENSNGVSGYYDRQGNSLQKAFLKAPLAFSRISSKFSAKRLHPILHTVRAHPGVDYAAPMGTPIKTVGDGVITGIGYSKTTGNHIIIRHCNGYVTRYYHMSKFARGMKKNKSVLQGEVIGHVGMTGLATGPHLCFGIKKNGKLLDPLTYNAPSATPVNPLEMEEFLAKAKKLSQRMLAALAQEMPDKESV